jgi:putative aldouronate transport system substrate-binding protein
MKGVRFKIGGWLLLSLVLGSAATAWGAAKRPVELRIEVFDRAVPGYQADNNLWTKYVQQNFGKPNNIVVKFIPVQRTQEIEKLNILMASGDAPDLVFTYDIFAVYNYVRYGGLADLGAPLNRYGKRLKKYLGRQVLKEGVFNGKQYSIPAKRVLYGAMNGFIRKDWLDKLGLPVPRTTEEWYRAMKAFKEKDPGKLGNKVIPFAMTTYIQNLTWNCKTLLDSFKKPMTPEQFNCWPEWLQPGAKDGFRFLNKLYNEGLISLEFALDRDGKKYERDIQQGRVGFFIGNFDLPYRITPGLASELKKNVPGAELAPCDPFVNSQGKHRKQIYGRQGLYMMVPKSSKRVAEVIKYLNWMARPQVLDFLLNGEKGVHYKELRDGIPISILVDGPKRWTTDIALIVNGKDYHDPKKNMIAGAFSCPGYESEWLKSYKMSLNGDLYVEPLFPIESEAKLKKTLEEKNAVILAKILTCKPAEFNRGYDSLVQEYLKMGGKQVMADRKKYCKANGRIK